MPNTNMCDTRGSRLATHTFQPVLFINCFVFLSVFSVDYIILCLEPRLNDNHQINKSLSEITPEIHRKATRRLIVNRHRQLT